MAKRPVHYVLSTHWDREWYQSFQDYRRRLVLLMDELLDGFRDGRLDGPFTTDGQAIILDDYLEIRPERRAEVEKLARAGKLSIGPWFVLPDEFLVSGESFVRNIRLGHEVAESFGGKPAKAGFACDLFGHVSQLPQVFAGFGIDNALLWRGVNFNKPRHFLWKGADGTELVVYKFPPIGYCDYSFEVRGANRHDEIFDATVTAGRLDAYLDREAKITTMPPVLLFDGGDHQEWDQEAYRVLQKKMKDAKSPYAISHVSLEDYTHEMVKHRAAIKHRFAGELREPGRNGKLDGHQIHGVLSSRVWIKQDNALCQALLCLDAEPLAALSARALGHDPGRGYLSTAWRWLITNHPHDSICGCSIDAVHRDMEYRFAQALQIAEATSREALLQIGASIKGEIEGRDQRIVLHNPTAADYSGTAEVDILLSRDWPKFQEFFHFEELPAFSIHDARGNEVPYQRVAHTTNAKALRTQRVKFPDHLDGTIVRVSLPVDVPALGYTTLTVAPGEENVPKRHPMVPAMATSERSMENEHLAVRIECSGAVTLTDKDTGVVYHDLLTFEDGADIGDGWFHGQAVNDQKIASTAAAAEIVRLENGPFATAFRIRTHLMVPEEFDFRRMVRSERLVPLVIETTLRLRPGSRALEVETVVVNNVCDHRLRVLLPSGAAKATTYLCDSVFDVVERPIALREDNHEYHELEVETRPQESWSAVFDKKRGLAVVSTGLHESAVQDLPERPIALTLYRSTRRTVGTAGEPDGQLLHRELRFRYAIVPFAGEPDRTALFHLSQRLATGGVRGVQLRAKDQRLNRVAGRALPATGALLSLKGAAVLTSARLVGGALEVRVFNPNTRVVKASLHAGGGLKGSPVVWKKAQLVDFLSQPTKGGKLAVESGVIKLTLKPKQIQTIRIE